MKLLDAHEALGFVLSQTTHIERGVYAKKYPDIQYPALIPVDTSANEWATSVTYFTSDRFGQAGWVSGVGDDIARVDVDRTKNETNVHMGNIGYGYGLEEISQARWLGQDLQSDKAAAARRAAEEFIDRVAMLGDSEKGFVGLVNNGNVPVIAAPNGAGGTATWAEGCDKKLFDPDREKPPSLWRLHHPLRRHRDGSRHYHLKLLPL